MKTLAKLFLIIIFPFLTGIYMPDRSAYDDESPTNQINPEYLDGPFTGGFGEQSCHSCHFDYDLNMDGGSLTVEGLSQQYKPGKMYNISVMLESERLEIGGFQLTARFEDGTQAGEFTWEGNRLMLTPSINNDIAYLQHSAEGTAPTSDREISWSFTWQAPDEASQNIIVNIASNAGNFDDSSFGDWIYTKELILEPTH